MQDIETRIHDAVAYIRHQTPFAPDMGIVLGSGLGDFADQLSQPIVLPFSDIPGFPLPSVEGHAGALVLGTYGGKRVAALRGRVHYYEGFSQQEITIPVRVMHRLGAKTLLLTNAAGGVNLNFSQGALMLITDHINYSGQNPLRGQNLDDFGPRFPDMSDIYTRACREKLLAEALKQGIELQQGVYLMYMGPSFETPAEIRAFRGMGADAVGMSTAPEAIVARHCGMQVIGISCITNMAAGVLDTQLSHAEVMETAEKVKEQFTSVVGLSIQLFA